MNLSELEQLPSVNFDQQIKYIGSSIFQRKKRAFSDNNVESKLINRSAVQNTSRERTGKAIRIDDSLTRREQKQELNFSLDPSGVVAGNTNRYADFLLKPNETSPTTGRILPQVRKRLPGFYVRNLSLEKQEITKQSSITASGGSVTLQMKAENDRLRKEIAKLKETNENLLEFIRMKMNVEFDDSKILNELDSETKNDNETLQNRAVNLTVKNNLMKMKMDSLEKENEELKKSLTVYRKTVLEGKLRDAPLTAFGKVVEASPDNKAPSSPESKLQGKAVADSGFGDRIARIIKTFSEFNSLEKSLDTAMKECGKILNCGFVRILLVDVNARNCYTESGGSVREKLHVGLDEIDIIVRKKEIKADEGVLNFADSVDDLKKIFNNQGQGLSVPVFSSENTEDFLGAIQVLRPLERHTKGAITKRGRSFYMVDELMLDIFAKFISLLLGYHVKDWLLRKERERNSLYNTSIVSLVNSKTPQKLLENVRSKLPNYFGFEAVGLLFYDNDTANLYTYDIHKTTDLEYFSTKPLKYPSRLGLSGHCLSMNADVYYSNEPKRSPAYQEDIDNSAGVTRMRNLLISVLRDESDKVVGVIQLVNKLSGDVDKEDQGKLRDMHEILSSLVTQTNKINRTHYLTLAFDDTVKEMEKKFGTLD